MFAQSMTAHIITSLVKMAENSFMIALFLKLFQRLKEDFATSRLYNILKKIVSFIQTQYKSSYLESFVNSNGRINSMYQRSWLCGIVCFMLSVISKITGFVYCVFERMASGGICYSVMKRLTEKDIFKFHAIFALLIGFMIVCPHELWNNLYAVMMAFAFGTWFLIRVYKGSEKACFENIHFGLVIFVLFATVVSVLSPNKADALRIMLFLYSAIIFGLLAGKLGSTEDKLLLMIKILCTAGAVTSVVGIFQRFAGVEVNPEYVDIATSGNMPGRVFSTFANPNNFAELLVMIMPVTLAMVYVAESKRDKWIFAIFFVLDLIALGMSYSRSCWIALAISLVIMVIVYDWRLLVPLMIGALFVLPLLPETIFNRILSIGSMSDSSNSYRLHIWNGAIKVIRNYFVSGLGAGPANYKMFYRPLADFASVTAPHSHMIYMELVIEFGIFGALGFFGYFISVIRKGFAALSCTEKKFRMILIAGLGSMAGMMFVCAAEYVWFYPRDMFVFWVLLGIIISTTSLAVKSRQ